MLGGDEGNSISSVYHHYFKLLRSKKMVRSETINFYISKASVVSLKMKSKNNLCLHISVYFLPRYSL